MKWHLATNEQLNTIIKYDSDCPLFLFRRAVEEMLSRNLFDRIIRRCFQIVFGNEERISKIYKFDIDDFLQMGRMEIYRAIDKYKTGKGMNFLSFSFLVVKQDFIRQRNHMEAQKRDNQKVLSYHAKTNDETEFLDFFKASLNVEKYVVNKVTIEQLLKKVNKHQRSVVLLRLKGYQFAEISEQLGRGCENSMSQAYNLAIKKLRKWV